MNRWIETELKLGLPNEAAWSWVRDRLGPGVVALQQNHFFDRSDRALRAHRIGVRLRSEGTHRTLTVKSAGEAAGDSAISRRIELESPVEHSAFDTALRDGLTLAPWIAQWRRLPADDPAERAELADFLDRLEDWTHDRRLLRYAGFSNRRERLRFAVQDAEGCFEVGLDLDRTEYPAGYVDFEIEVEMEGSEGRDGSLSRTHRALTDWLERAGGIHPASVQSKLARMNAILAAEEAARPPLPPRSETDR